MLRKTGSILLLSWTSGCLDALGFLGLGRVFTANMTGNTVLLGMDIAQGNWPEMLRSLLAVLGFSLGVIIGSFLTSLDNQQETSLGTREITRALLIEAGVLLVFALLWLLARPVSIGSRAANLLIGISGFAMGQQSATALRIGLPGISTTYISGTITTLMTNVARLLALPLHLPTTTPAPAITNHIEHERPARLAAVWLTYILAALIGGYGEIHFATPTAFLPLIAVLVAIILHQSA